MIVSVIRVALIALGLVVMPVTASAQDQSDNPFLQNQKTENPKPTLQELADQSELDAAEAKRRADEAERRAEESKRRADEAAKAACNSERLLDILENRPNWTQDMMIECVEFPHDEWMNYKVQQIKLLD